MQLVHLDPGVEEGDDDDDDEDDYNDEDDEDVEDNNVDYRLK